MSVETRVEPLAGALPSVVWRWDPETEILSGSFTSSHRPGGYTGTVELTDDEGSIAVVDVDAGCVRGLDIVVWPELVEVAALAVPAAARVGIITMGARASQPGVASLELDTALSLAANPARSLFHLRIGPRRQVEAIRIADSLVVDVDQKRRLAGFWLENVPGLSDQG